MKKLIISLTFLLFLFSNSFSQIFVGGSLGFSTSSNSVKNGSTTTDGTSSYSLELSPSIGYYLNESMAIGVELLISTEEETDPSGSGTQETKNSTSLSGIGPFVRYHLVEIDKFKIFGQAQIGLAFGSSVYKVAGTTSYDADVFALRIKAFPGIAYELTDKIDLELSFGNIQFANVSSKSGDNKTSNTSFDLNLSTELSLGFVCKF
jgi:hypothetical protein